MPFGNRLAAECRKKLFLTLCRSVSASSVLMWQLTSLLAWFPSQFVLSIVYFNSIFFSTLSWISYDSDSLKSTAASNTLCTAAQLIRFRPFLAEEKMTKALASSPFSHCCLMSFSCRGSTAANFRGYTYRQAASASPAIGCSEVTDWHSHYRAAPICKSCPICLKSQPETVNWPDMQIKTERIIKYEKGKLIYKVQRR